MTTIAAPRSSSRPTAAPGSPDAADGGRHGRRRGPAPVLRLRLQAAAALLLVAALLAATLSAFATARADLSRLTTVSQPRAAAAADLHRVLADLDAQHADSLVVGYSAVPPTDGTEPVLVDDGVLAALTAQADRQQAAHDLTLLAALSGRSPAGQAASGRTLPADPDVQAVIDGLGVYDAFSGTEEFSASSQTDPVVGRPPELALDYYAKAEGLLQQSLLPRVQTLVTAANSQVADDRAEAGRDGRRGALLLAVVGALALVMLDYWQVDLTRRHRRILNPALLVATAAVLAVVLAGGLTLLGAAARVDTAVRQGSTPAAAVAQAQAEAADAEAAQSRWLVDDAYRPSLQARFDELTAQLRGLARGTVSSPGVTRTLREYLASDALLRRLADAGQLDQAAVQLTGVTRGEVAFAYYDLSLQLDQLSLSSAARFDAEAAAADSNLSGWTTIAAALLGASLLLVVAGVRPRLAEFA